MHAVQAETGPEPRRAVRMELARTLARMGWLPLQALDFLLRRSALRGELRADLELPARIDPEPRADFDRARPLRVFLSCAEASGEIHAVNFVRELRAEAQRQGAPAPSVSGLGGRRLGAEGVECIGDPVSRAVMGIHGVRQALPYYLELLERCAEHFRSERPEVLVMVDSPALHVPLGRIAKRYGIPVLHFVTPQHWAWAPWRTADYARAVDRALTILPFERAWFTRRGLDVAYVGHPLLDRLAGLPASRARDSLRIALLPGSRARVIDLNLPWMLGTLARLRERDPRIEVQVLQADDQHRFRIEEHVAGANASSWARIEVGELHHALPECALAFAVSGTVLLDLLHHRLPTVCIYRVRSRREIAMYRHGLCTPYFASINLLAAGEVVPEFCFRGDGPRTQVVDALERLLFDRGERARTRRGLERAADRLGPPGACRRAAMHALSLARREPA